MVKKPFMGQIRYTHTLRGHLACGPLFAASDKMHRWALKALYISRHSKKFLCNQVDHNQTSVLQNFIFKCIMLTFFFIIELWKVKSKLKSYIQLSSSWDREKTIIASILLWLKSKEKRFFLENKKPRKASWSGWHFDVDVRVRRCRISR